MTNRKMGDAIHANVASLPDDLQLVAGYGTGTPDIRWTDLNWARFPSIPHVVIDQGSIGAPLYSANVIDIETGAWNVGQVTGWMNNATAPRPTVYVNRGNEWAACLAALHSPRFGGDVWLSYPGWMPGESLPPLPAGCRYVAVQNRLDVQSVYDLSVVIDDAWPALAKKGPTLIKYANGVWQTFAEYVSPKGVHVVTGLGSDGAVWQSVSPDGVRWTVTRIAQ
jgi:hypothetical protein